MKATSASHTQAPQVPFSALKWFFALTFAITWGIGGFFIFLPERAVSLFGELQGAHPLYFLATWGPGVSGIIIVTIYGGTSGLRAFFSRVAYWRAPAICWLIVLVGLPLAFIIGSLLKGGPLLAPLPEDGASMVFILLIIMLFLGPMEEFGWRGVAQPLLQRRIAPIWAGAIIGAVWGVWHLPAFYLSGTVYAEWNFPLFLVGTITMAVLVTPLFNASRGGLLLPMLFHWQAINPFFPDAQPWDTWLLVGVTSLIAWHYRDNMFGRDNAVTEVIPSQSSGAEN